MNFKQAYNLSRFVYSCYKKWDNRYFEFVKTNNRDLIAAWYEQRELLRVMYLRIAEKVYQIGEAMN